MNSRRLLYLHSLSSSSPTHTPKEEYIIGQSEEQGEIVGNHTEQPQSLNGKIKIGMDQKSASFFPLSITHFHSSRCIEVVIQWANTRTREHWDRRWELLGGAALRPTGAARKGDAGDQEDGDKASGQFFCTYIAFTLKRSLNISLICELLGGKCSTMTQIHHPDHPVIQAEVEEPEWPVQW